MTGGRVPYCTRQDLEERLGADQLRELTDFEETGEVNEDRVARAIEDAQAEVDAYAAHRYPVPFADPVPAMIRKVALDLTVYALFRARGFDEKADQAVIEAHRAAIQFLSRLSEGKVSIGAAQPPKDQGARVTAAERVFSRDSMEDF